MIKAALFFKAILLAFSLLVVGANATPTNPRVAATFSFVSMGDGQDEYTNLPNTTNQIATLSSDLIIFNDDLEDNGVVSSEINERAASLKPAGIFNHTFPVRGNHDDYVAGSEAAWENYYENSPSIRVFPVGVTNYVSLNSSSDYLSNSFIYGNSIFNGLDVPGNANLLTSKQLTFLDSRLIYAESHVVSTATAPSTTAITAKTPNPSVTYQKERINRI
jgi:hypothetical protein